MTRWWWPYSTVCSPVNIQGNSYRLREYPGLTLPQEVSTNRRRGQPRESQETQITNHPTPAGRDIFTAQSGTFSTAIDSAETIAAFLLISLRLAAASWSVCPQHSLEKYSLSILSKINRDFPNHTDFPEHTTLQNAVNFNADGPSKKKLVALGKTWTTNGAAHSPFVPKSRWRFSDGRSADRNCEGPVR